MDTIVANGVTLATHTWPGDGSAIVAIHGLTANHTCSYPMAEVLTPRGVRFATN